MEERAYPFRRGIDFITDGGPCSFQGLASGFPHFYLRARIFPNGDDAEPNDRASSSTDLFSVYKRGIKVFATMLHTTFRSPGLWWVENGKPSCPFAMQGRFFELAGDVVFWLPFSEFNARTLQPTTTSALED